MRKLLDELKIYLWGAVFFGGIYGLTLFKPDQNDEYNGGLIVLYLLAWIVALIILALWAPYKPLRSYNAKADVDLASKILGVCKYCGKKLPSFLTGKCPHCTADL